MCYSTGRIVIFNYPSSLTEEHSIFEYIENEYGFKYKESTMYYMTSEEIEVEFNPEYY